jgi:MoxR-like ATPase
VELVRVTREHELVAVGASVRGSLALERAARGWARLNDRSFVVPDDVERLFVPVLVHRIVFRPAFLAEARRNGWSEAAEQFKASCLALAPKPEADPDGEVVPFGRPG